MARYGAKYIRWAPFAAESPEPENALPKYGPAISLAELNKLTDAPTFAEGKQYGDDGLAEYVSEFVEVAIDLEITDLPVDIEQPVLGVKKTGTPTNAEITHFSSDDTAPYGGLGFVSCIMRNNVRKYQGIFYPKVKAAMQGEEFTTKGDSITLTGGKLKFVGAAANSGDWKLKSNYLASFAEAKKWVDDLHSGTAPGK